MTKKDPTFIVLSSNKESKDLIESQYDCYDDLPIVQRSKASINSSRTFVDYDNNISVKSEYGRQDYEWFRTTNTSNLSTKEIITLCQKAYEKVGIIRNIIDTMSEFATQGAKILHRDATKQLFCNEWWKRVNGAKVCERFANMALRLGNVPINIAYAKINLAVEDEMKKIRADINQESVNKTNITKREIPYKYTFIHPNDIEIIGGDIGLYVGKPFYALKLNKNIATKISKINSITSPEIRDVYTKMTDSLKNYIKSNSTLIPLNQDRFEMAHYKKDDWQVWGLPPISSILDDLVMLERLRLADMSALDGAISTIRHWKVGIIDPSNPKNSILPTKAGINKIKNILANGVGGGTIDLVTGPEVAFQESKSEVHRFLGSEKYKVTLDAIYDGLGIPPPLRSGGASPSGTNNYISLKTLIERLQYLRNMLYEFWDKQLFILQKAMNWAHAPKLAFDEMILSDEAAEKALIVQLVDRDIISQEAVQEYFGYIPEIENARIKRNMSSIKNKNKPAKASPFHNANFNSDAKKILLQTGTITPSEAGVDLYEKDPNETVPAIPQTNPQQPGYKPKVPGGRPKNVVETQKRKKKPNFKPRTNAKLLMWANKAYASINKILTPALVASYGKNNLRQLTEKEFEQVEQIKFDVLCSLPAYTKVNESVVQTCLKSNLTASENVKRTFTDLLLEFTHDSTEKPTVEEVRQLQVLSYVTTLLNNF